MKRQNVQQPGRTESKPSVWPHHWHDGNWWALAVQQADDIAYMKMPCSASDEVQQHACGAMPLHCSGTVHWLSHVVPCYT
mgnify:CR=1 FL=1